MLSVGRLSWSGEMFDPLSQIRSCPQNLRFRDTVQSGINTRDFTHKCFHWSYHIRVLTISVRCVPKHLSRTTHMLYIADISSVNVLLTQCQVLDEVDAWERASFLLERPAVISRRGQCWLKLAGRGPSESLLLQRAVNFLKWKLPVRILRRCIKSTILHKNN